MEESMLGEYEDGLPNGQGTFTSPDGTKYVVNSRMEYRMVKEHTLIFMEVDKVYWRI